MNDSSDKEKLTEAISTVKRYENFRVQKLWGIALISISFINILFIILFETTTLISRNSELIYLISHSVLIAIIIGIFCYNLIQTKKFKIKNSKIVSTYYAGLGIALLLIFYFFAINFMITEYLEHYSLIARGSYTSFPFILFGYPIPLESVLAPHYTYVYWGDNIAFLASYFLLRYSIKECKFKELLYSTIFFFIFDFLSYIFDVFVFKTEIFGNGIFLVVPSFIAVLCGIYAIRRAYKTLNKQSNLNLSDING
ncbi:MAG: hypothetical protein ACTSQ4_05185 [Candidatus Heimdallarchaeaceae archaeon]